MVAEHTVKAFDEDITRLRGLIAEMGGLAEVAIEEAMQALINGDEELAKGVVERDKKLDALEVEVDRLAIRIIALRAPMADDPDRRPQAVRATDADPGDGRVGGGHGSRRADRLCGP